MTAALRLAAILAADYSRLAGADEAGTAKAALGRREAARPTTFNANEAPSPRRIEPFLQVAFLPLPVIPHLVDRFEFVRD
jgi:hypothetical protein